MSLEEIRKAAIKILPQYEKYINKLIRIGAFDELWDFLRTSPKSKETAEIRNALLPYTKE